MLNQTLNVPCEAGHMASTDITTSRMLAAFFGHGTPMNALERNRYTDAWRAFGAAVTLSMTSYVLR